VNLNTINTCSYEVLALSKINVEGIHKRAKRLPVELLFQQRSQEICLDTTILKMNLMSDFVEIGLI